MGAAAVLIGVGAAWGGSRLTPGARIPLLVLGVLVAAYGVYLLLLSLTWSVLAPIPERLLSRWQASRAGAEGRVIVMLRIPIDGDDEPRWSRSLWERFDAEGDGVVIVSQSTGDGLSTLTLEGPTSEVVIERVRSLARGSQPPPDAYLWIPEPAGKGIGRRYPL